MRPCIAIVLSLLAVSCGGDPPTPTAPTPPPVTVPPVVPPQPTTVATIAGLWTGRIDATHPTVGATTYPIEVTVQQRDTQVTGTWRQPAGANWRGEIAGTLSGFGADTTIQGTTTWDAETDTGTGRCFGRAAIKGPASPPSMTWTSEDVRSDTCSGVLTNVRWVLTKVN